MSSFSKTSWKLVRELRQICKLPGERQCKGSGTKAWDKIETKDRKWDPIA